jgi:hypothetical protein
MLIISATPGSISELQRRRILANDTGGGGEGKIDLGY